MGLKYAAIHSSIHAFSSIAIAYFFELDLLQFLIVFTGSGIIDIDHLPLLRRHEIRGAFKKVVLQGFGKIRKYPLHNYAIVLVSALSSLLSLSADFFMAGLFSLAIFLHLLWDLVEDVFIFKVGAKHWKV